METARLRRSLRQSEWCDKCRDEAGMLRSQHHSIRLITCLPPLQGGVGTFTIRCKSEVFSMCPKGPPPYTALSYTWTSCRVSNRSGVVCPNFIILDGRELLVSENLWLFLWQASKWELLRKSQAEDREEWPLTLQDAQSKEWPGAWFWIDALSINQKDLGERRYQVSIMSRIFSSASNVTIWLGPACEDSDRAMLSLAAGLDDLEPAVITAVERLCQRPYWTRLWVFQELRYARGAEVMCGTRTLPWDTFKQYFRDPSLVTTQYSSECNVWQSTPAASMLSMCEQGLETSLFNLLRGTRHLLCSDPLDRVYALLSVATSGHQGMEANYTITLPTLLNWILRNMHELTPPTSLAEVSHQSRVLEKLFNVSRNFTYCFVDPSRHGARPPPKPLRTYQLQPIDQPISLWWTFYYDHHKIQRLLLESWEYSFFKGPYLASAATDEHLTATAVALRRCMFDVNVRHRKFSYLEEAIARRDAMVLKLLLKIPMADIYVRNVGGWSILQQAIRTGDPVIVRTILDSGRLDLRKQTLPSWMPLLEPVRNSWSAPAATASADSEFCKGLHQILEGRTAKVTA